MAVKVIFIKNPFSPAKGRVIKVTEATDQPLSFYVGEFVSQLPENKAFIQLNGVQSVIQAPMMLEQIVPDNSFIVVMPAVEKGGKSILGLVAVIALSVVSMGVGNALATSAGVWGTASYAGAAAVMFLGGQLISKFTAPKIDTGKYETEDPTYSWNGIQTMEGQGNGIAITYGTVCSGGQSIVKFTTNANDDQYFNWLISAGEGPVEIKDIKINDNPIENYKNVVCEIRNGTNDQSVISNFNDTIQSKMVSYELNNNEWRIDVIDGNSAQGLIVDIECSNGLYHANDNGSLGTAWVDITAQYALEGTDDWKAIVTNKRISGKKAGPVRQQFRIDNIPQGKYQVRVTVTNRSASVNSSRDAVRVWWTTLSTVVYDDFIYPNTALIGIKALATSQLSGSTPSLKFIKTREKVWVWNPLVNAYEEQSADNPAWASYDFVHGARRLKNIHTGQYEFEVQGAPAEMMMYEQFKAWADNCETMKLKINIEISQINDFWSIVNKEIAPVGRGMVVQFGTRFGCIYDHKSEPVQLFNMGNIIADSFELSYLGSEDRADAVEITYINADRDYTKDTMSVYGDNYDALDTVNNPTQITMNGITNYQQAFREGKYQLKCNQLLTETIKFKASIDSIGCMVGDLILVNHDVPRWGVSGRISDVLDEQNLILPIDPDEITLNANDYAIMIRTLAGNLYTYNVDYMEMEYGAVRVTVAGTFNEADMPQPFDLFSLGRIEAAAKPCIVKSITRTNDLERTITAINYVEGVFEENYDIPIIDYSTSEEEKAVNVINLQAHQTAYKNKAGQQLCKMFVSWKLPENTKADYFTIYLSEDSGSTWRLAGTSYSMEIQLDTTANTSYYVKVVTHYRLKESSGTISNSISAGVDAMPPDVIKIDCELLGDGTRRFWWNYEYPEVNDINGFKFRYTQGNDPDWERGIEMHTGYVTVQPFETKAIRQGVHTIMVKAVDNAGNESENPAIAIINLGDLIEENVLWKHDLGADGWAGVEHDGIVGDDGILRGTAAGKPLIIKTALQPLAYGQFWLDYGINISCKASIQYCIGSNANMWDTPETPMWDSPEEPMWTFEGIFKPYTGRVVMMSTESIHLSIEISPKEGEVAEMNKLVACIDVPDELESFQNLTVDTDGLTLPIKCPNYTTTAVHVDAVQTNVVGHIELEVLTVTPCRVRFVKVSNDASLSRVPIEVVADLTWQGFKKEII